MFLGVNSYLKETSPGFEPMSLFWKFFILPNTFSICYVTGIGYLKGLEGAIGTSLAKTHIFKKRVRKIYH
jgi:hypothetical protein